MDVLTAAGRIYRSEPSSVWVASALLLVHGDNWTSVAAWQTDAARRMLRGNCRRESRLSRTCRYFRMYLSTVQRS